MTDTAAATTEERVRFRVRLPLYAPLADGAKDERITHDAMVTKWSQDGSRFCGVVLVGQHYNESFRTIEKACRYMGVDPDLGFHGWTFAHTRDLRDGTASGHSVLEADGRFDGKALADRVNAAAAAVVKPVKLVAPTVLAARTVSVRTPFLQPIRSSSTVYVRARKGNGARRTRRPAASRTTKAPTATAHLADIGTKHATAMAAPASRPLPKGKRVREGKHEVEAVVDLSAPGPDGTARAMFKFEYDSPLDMFAEWYDSNHDKYGYDASVSAHDVWEGRLPRTHPSKREMWCRSFWERKYARDIHEAYAKRTRLILNANGKQVCIDMQAPGVVPTPTEDELAVAFYPEAKGAVVDPRTVPYARWDQALMERWLARGSRWKVSAAPTEDPVIECVVGRRFSLGLRAHYLCRWAYPADDAKPRRIVRAVATSSSSSSSSLSCLSSSSSSREAVSKQTSPIRRDVAPCETWHSDTVLFQAPALREAVRIYDAEAKTRSIEACRTFLKRMVALGHGDVLDILKVEMVIYLYDLGVLVPHIDGPRPKTLRVIDPTYYRGTIEEMRASVPRGRIYSRPGPSGFADPDRCFAALKADCRGQSLADLPPPPDSRSAPADKSDKVSEDADRNARSTEIEKSVLVKRLMRTQWMRVERRTILSDIEIEDEDNCNDDDDDDKNDGKGGAPKPSLFYVAIEERMRQLTLKSY